MTKNNKAGFSLVELMVVVAIIGILATIAVPNFQKFQARAKQSNARVELTGLYTAQKSFFTEYNTYHVNLPLIGYVPDGLTNDANACPTGVAQQRVYETGFNSGGVGTSLVSLAPGGASLPCGNTNIEYVTRYPATVREPTDAMPATSTASTDAFSAMSRGNIGSSGSPTDVWIIDQNRSLANTVNGAR